MKVTITTDGAYSEFEGQFAGATRRKKGDVVDYPDWYARELITHRLAVIPVKVKVEPEPEPVVQAPKRTYVRKARKPSGK